MPITCTPLLFSGSRLLKLYSYYSLFLSLLTFLIVALDTESRLFGQFIPTVTIFICAAYVTTAAAFSGIAHVVTDNQKIISYFFLEVVFLVGLMMSAGGLDSAISSLLLIPVVASNLLATGVLGYAVAAWTALAVLAIQHIWLNHLQAHHMVNSGTYGFICFLLAFLTQTLSKRLEMAQKSATTHEKAARRIRKLSLYALRELPSGVLACDSSGQILFSNQKAEEWFALKGGNTLPPHFQISSDKDKTEESDVLIEHSGNRYIIRKITLHDSEPGDFLLYIVDHSRVIAEAQHMKLASLGRLTASIAHEIRNPLSALRQASQLLAETPYLDHSERHLTEIMEQHCMRINRTVEDILQLSRKRQPVVETLKLKPWLEHFGNLFNEHNQHTSFTWHLHCSDELQGCIDPDHLQQILHNLCSNGLRYARAENKERAMLRVSAGQYDSQRVFVDVTDNGKGIDQEQQKHLFEPFFTTEHDGTGLGLYLCRELCEANNASIDIKPTPNGTCFRMLLTKEVPNNAVFSPHH